VAPVLRKFIDAMLQKDYRLRPSAGLLEENLGSLICAVIPSASKVTGSSWVNAENILGTDGPLRDSIIEYEEIYVPGTFDENKAAYERFKQICYRRNTILGRSHPASVWSTSRFAWAA
jgi:hypothetical protein